MLLLCALIVGSSSVWAEEVFYTLDGTVTTGGNSPRLEAPNGSFEASKHTEMKYPITAPPLRGGGEDGVKQGHKDRTP